MAAGSSGDDNLVMRAAPALARTARRVLDGGAALHLDKNLPVASGIGGGSADAAAALRLLTRLWGIDPAHASAVAPALGADVPACLLSMTARGEGAGDALDLVDDPAIAGTPVLLVNPLVALSTARGVRRAGTGSIAARSATGARGATTSSRRRARWSRRSARCSTGSAQQRGATFVRMSGSGATCFALFDDEDARDAAAAACPAIMVASGQLPALRRRAMTRPILTAAAMRAAEQAAMHAGTSNDADRARRRRRWPRRRAPLRRAARDAGPVRAGQ